jgi:dTDP-4-dehydrorhamnose 3,5-epimerase-like enzyme
VKATIEECRVLKLPKISMPQGNITPVEGARTIPFDIARVFYFYDVPVDAARGGHAHRRLEQVILCVMGSFDVVIDDGANHRTVMLRRADEALYVPPGIWGELVNFSSGAVCLTLASHAFDEEEYIRRYEDFAAWRAEHG